MPRPGASGATACPSFTSGLGRPVTMSSHHGPRLPDAGVPLDVAVVVGGDRRLHPDPLPDRGYEVGQVRAALVRDREAGEGMHHHVAAGGGGAGRPVQRARLVLQQVDPEIDLQEREAVIHALLEAPPLGVAVLHFGRIRVQAYAVAEAATQHLVDGHAEGLPREVPAGHLDAADPAGLAGGMAELLDLPGYLVDAAGG